MLNVARYENSARSSSSAEASAPLFELSSAWSVLKRRRLSILMCLATIVALAVAYLLVATPRYVGSAQVIVDTRQDQAVLRNQENNNADSGTTDTGLVDSQVDILNSAGTALKVVQALHLDKDPEFVGPDDSLIGSMVEGTVAFVKKTLALPSGPDDPSMRAVEALQALVNIKRDQETYVITINAWSKRADKAAAIANQIAKSYIDGILEAKSTATSQAGQWAQGRLNELRDQATRADQDVESFKSKNGIVDTDRGLLDQQQLSELNTQLVTATADSAQAKARVDRAQQLAADPLGSGTVSDALTNPVVSRIRAQYLDLAGQQRTLAARLGPKHEAVLKLNEQLVQLRKSLSDELQQILDAYRSDYSIASAREESLKASIAKQVSLNDTTSMAQVKLRTLESAADSSRAMYTDFLQKAQQATQQESFPVADARVVTAATVPLKTSSPKKLIVTLAALAIGLSVGVGQAVVRDWMVRSFDSERDVRLEAGVPFLGMLPRVKVRGRAAFANYINASPNSRYAEVLRNIWATVANTAFGKPVVLGVTSAVPGEGKTSVAISLARLIAKSGTRTLLIDGDLSRAALSAELARGARLSLVDIVNGEADLASAVITDAEAGLHILPCVSHDPKTNRLELFASANFGALLEKARATYDFVVIDLAPIVPVVDCKVASRWLDMFLLVIEHRVTSREAVQAALTDNAIRAKVVGAVLNMVDASSLKHHEEPFGKRYGSYYLE